MTFLTVSSKGQITLPVDQRRRLGLKAHDRIVAECVDDAIVIRRVKDFMELEGCLGKALSSEEEEQAIRDAASERALGSD
jgi:AbrB family looped-hinge helix DNA binding protein